MHVCNKLPSTWHLTKVIFVKWCHISTPLAQHFDLGAIQISCVMHVCNKLPSTWQLAKVTLDIQVMSHLVTRVRCGPLLSPENQINLENLKSDKY